MFTRNHDPILISATLQDHRYLFKHIFSLYQKAADYRPWANSSQLPTFLNNVLLKHS